MAWYLVPSFIFAIYPFIFLYIHNFYFIPVSEVVSCLLGATGVFGISVLLGKIAIASKQRRTAILSTLWLFLFLYGPIVGIGEAILKFKFGLIVPVSEAVFLIWSIALFFLLLITIRKSDEFAKGLNRFFFRMAAILFVITLGSLGATLVERESFSKVSNLSRDTRPDLSSVELKSPLPNIYYIILDGYGRADVLKDQFGFDNSAFIESLHSMGFRVAIQGTSNYTQTVLSLASSLNMSYVDSLLPGISSELVSRGPLLPFLQDSALVRALRKHGYRTVAFSSGLGPTELFNSDLYFGQKKNNTLFQFYLVGLKFPGLAEYVSARLFETHRDKILYTLDNLSRLEKIQSPMFIFAHLICPHPPFVFSETGEFKRPVGTFSVSDGITFNEQPNYVADYIAQVKFINTRILNTIKSILDSATVSPVIVLQGDHGPASKLDWEKPTKASLIERFGILEAVHVPLGESSSFYDSITPVNLFRSILSDLSGTPPELVPDKNIFSTFEKPFKFVDKTEEVLISPNN